LRAHYDPGESAQEGEANREEAPGERPMWNKKDGSPGCSAFPRRFGGLNLMALERLGRVVDGLKPKAG